MEADWRLKFKIAFLSFSRILLENCELKSDLMSSFFWFGAELALIVFFIIFKDTAEEKCSWIDWMFGIVILHSCICDFYYLYNYYIDTTVVNQLEEGSRTEHLQAQRCRARLDHLESADADNLSEWSDMRLKRILVDYMLRMSYYDTALKLAESSNILVMFFSLPHLCTSGDLREIYSSNIMGCSSCKREVYL